MLKAFKRGWNALQLRSRSVSVLQRLGARMHYIRAFLRPDVVLLEGCTESGKSLSILRAGIADTPAAYFFTGQVLTELRAEQALGRRWIWTLPSVARQHDCAFVLFRVSSRRAALAHRLIRTVDGHSFYLPLMVGAQVDLTDRSRLLRSRDLRDDLRRIRKRGFQYSISRKKRDLETFIRFYHDPYVTKVHGFDAVGMNLPRLLASCASDDMPEPWVLLKVELDGEWVAGDLLVSGEGSAALMEIGVKDADPTHVRRGALQAAYWLSLEYLWSQGHKRVSLMHARPFLRSGVLQYKLKFSPSLKPTSSNGFLLFFDTENDAVQEVLLQEPLLVFDGGSLRAVWFALDAASPSDPRRIPVDRLAVAGIKNIERVVLRQTG
jgi:hypothetical protein